ncbi:MAG: DNA polymerase III subunit gamma/tau [Bacteroidota bacterium]|nr:DNA polymerase III subunit gamma/tau [Bacteroidota bacterium]
MTDFLVSALKYRPSSFDEVVGQEAISITLKNAIKNNHLGQSFLFCGPRGVGKTSCARILAKTINCEKLTSDCNACNSCKSCTSFNNSNSFNIHELDAASNNGVDKIRDLIDQVRFAPQIGDFNVYIIDEVHMLSTNAFNAFLKTLEEPPKHAKFILATTEKHKIIPTILSRCQIFDFKRITVDDIIKHLTFISKAENVEVELEALHVIAEKSEGGLRDALSIFDKLVSFSPDQLTYQTVIDHLRVLDHDYYFKIIEVCVANDISSIMLIFDEILSRGFDANNFINGLAGHLRDLLVCKTENAIKLLEKSEDLQKKYLKQAGEMKISFLIEALKLCNECDIQYQNKTNGRLFIELCLIRISSIDKREKEIIDKTFISGTATEKTNKHNFSKDSNIVEEEEAVKSQSTQNNSNSSLLSQTDNNLKSNTISISATLTEIENRVEAKNSKDRINPFSEDDLYNYWPELVKKLKNDGKINLSIALNNYKPNLLGNSQIEISLDNITQQELFSQDKEYITNLLQDYLNNDSISITTHIIKNTKDEIPFTTKDKYEKMQKENPNLEKLAEKLNLDPDY